MPEKIIPEKNHEALTPGTNDAKSWSQLLSVRWLVTIIVYIYSIKKFLSGTDIKKKLKLNYKEWMWSYKLVSNLCLVSKLLKSKLNLSANQINLTAKCWVISE